MRSVWMVSPRVPLNMPCIEIFPCKTLGNAMILKHFPVCWNRMKTGITKIRLDIANYFIFIVISSHLFLKIHKAKEKKHIQSCLNPIN